MKPKVYIETTIPSYLTAWPSRDLIRAGHQHATREWWESRRSDFDLYVSQAVIQEVSLGDQVAAAERLETLKGLPTLQLTEEAAFLAHDLILKVPLPPKAELDALHIALATVNGMDFLLTWNCTHIANAMLRSRIESICRSCGHQPPVICTPQDIMES